MAASEPLYTGESVWIRIPNVKRNTLLVTDANAPDTFTYTIQQNGVTVSGGTGELEHNAATPGTWEKEVFLPTTKGVTTFQAIATNAGVSVGEWRGFVYVK